MDNKFSNDSSDDEGGTHVSTTTKHRTRVIESSDSDSNHESTPKMVDKSTSNNSNESSDKHEDEKIPNPKEEFIQEELTNAKKSTISDLYDSESSDDCDQFEDKREATQNIEIHNDEEPYIENHKLDGRHGESQRLSAKQAVDQMHKIKSESCRMLREKRFHLPYHRPKHVSLKEIMSKKKIQFVPGQKKLNWRMNQKELEEYAKKLEEKEKEMIELCKSDSEEEIETNKNKPKILNVEKPIEQDEQPSRLLIEPNSSEITENSNPSVDATSENNVITNLEPLISDTQVTNLFTKQNDSKSLKIHLETMDPTEQILSNFNENILIENNSNHSDSSMEDKKERDNDQDLQNEIESYEPNSQISEKRKNIQNLTSSSLAKPVLTGGPGMLIDLTGGSQELSGVDLLKQKYFYHSKMKTKEEMEREQERTQQPGTAMMNFKRELENQICKQRLEEWNKKRMEESTMKNEDNEIDDELTECEKILNEDLSNDKQDLNEENADLNENNGEEDTDESETDVEEDEEDEIATELSEKRMPKCDLIDDEAESDDDCSETDIEKDDDESNKKDTTKKRPSRIVKPLNDSDSSDEEEKESTIHQNTNGDGAEKSFENAMKTPIKIFHRDSKQSNDLFESQDTKKVNESFSLDSDDYLPLGQHVLTNITPVSNTEYSAISNREPSVEVKGRPDLASLVSPLIKLIDRRCISNENITHLNDETMSENYDDTPRKQEKWVNLQKKLFIEPDMSDNVENTQDLANLCSGKFPTQSVSETAGCKNRDLLFPFDKNNSYTDTEMTQNTESELLELCSGKFITTDHSSHEHNANDKKCNEIPNENLSNILEKINNVASKKSVNENLANNLNSLKPLVPGAKPKIATIKSFFAYAKKDGEVNLEKNNVNKNEETRIPTINSSPPRKMIITSSSDEESNDKMNAVNGKIKKLKSKQSRDRKRAKPLEISDDESDEESIISYNSSPEEHNYDDREVNYDSEENEVPVGDDEEEIILKKTVKKQTSEFFDNEAELTSEDEWKGSGDEDERGLDRLEWEEGDADQIDERKVTKELERIHRHQMLDQDIREVKILQDILLEDGDLEGGTRERKFKWKNLDSGIESGAVVGDDNRDETEDLQNEEQWRKQRHERVTFLREQMEKNSLTQAVTVETTFKISSRMSFVAPNVSSNDFIEKFQLRDENFANGNSKISEPTKKPNDLPSPVKKPFAVLKSNFKGFLSRGEASLNRLAVLAKTGVAEKDGETPRNLSSLAPGKKGNFVFTTVSPPCNKNVDEETKKAKRKKLENPSTPTLVKRMKIAEDRSGFGKSLFDRVS